MKRLYILFLAFFYLQINLFAQVDSVKKTEYYKVSEVRIFINDKSDINELRNKGLGLDHIKIYENYFDALLDSLQIDILKKSSYPYEIIIDDVTKDYLERTKESREKIKTKKPCQPLGFGYGSMGGFYTFSEVVAQLDTMRLLYPNLITVKDSIGASIEGRTIWAVKISDNPDVNESEPQVFYNSLIHAREPEGMMTVLYFMYYLLENYGTNPEVTYLVDNRELYFVPVINPDGYKYNQTISPNGGGMWRKNKRDNNNNGVFNTYYDGVDLNRNYGYMWGYDNIGSSANISNEDYRGTGPFSEPETQAVRDFCNSHNFLICNNYHSYSNSISSPWGYNSSQTPDSTIFISTIGLSSQLNGYIDWSDYPYSYGVNGGVNDWMYGEETTKPKIFSYLTEVGNDNDGFWPIPERIFPLASENCYPNKVLAWGPGVIDNPPHIFESIVYPSHRVPGEDSITITATESNPDNYNSVVTAYLYDYEDNLIDEFELNEINTNSYLNSILTPQEEDFYYFLLKDNGGQLPSNFYYKKGLKFTTAGPVIVDSILSVHFPAMKSFSTKPYLTNLGNTLPIAGVSMKIICEDPWIVNFPGVTTNFPTIQPGATAISNWVVSLRYDSTTFPGYFNLKFEIMSGGYCYWKDSLKFEPVIVGLDEEVNEVPTEFLLSQNFPNPFNPVTTIKYQVPHRSNVSLKIYDIIGNEIAELVNEEQEVGYYNAEFNASKLSSGVYFYRLQAGDFVQTRKMILLK